MGASRGDLFGQPDTEVQIIRIGNLDFRLRIIRAQTSVAHNREVAADGIDVSRARTSTPEGTVRIHGKSP